MQGTTIARSGTWVLGLLMLTLVGQAAAAERSVYFYGIHQVTEARWQEHLSLWRSEGVGRVIVSLESGPRFLLDDRAEAQKLADLFSLACARGIRIEGLILQDPSWALKPNDARLRLRTVSEFARRHPGTIDAVQIDVEVYTEPAIFGQGEGWSRFASMVAALRAELTMHPGGLRLEAAMPWWYGYKVSENEFRMISNSLDGVLLMVYGDRGGEPVAAEIETFQRKVLPAVLDLAGRGPAITVGVASYEHASASATARFSRQLDMLLAPASGYAGTAVFGDSE
jgi:hypothetical protein